MDEQPQRVRYFDGQLLGVDDLRAEQEYHRSMRYLHNRLHGSGVVSGLDVGVERGEGSGEALSVRPGFAIDPLGRELVLAERTCLTAADVTREGPRHLHLTWAQEPGRPVPVPDGGPAPTRWVERPRLSLDVPGERPDDALFLARIMRTASGALRVDVSRRQSLGRHGRPPVERRRYRGRRPPAAP